MWIKLLLSCLIILFCTFLGYFAASKYRTRRKFFLQMTTFNERYLNELEYARRPLAELLKREGESGEFYKMLKKYASERVTETEFSFLDGEERTLCGEYLSMLGTGDSLSQRNFFSAQKTTLLQKQECSERELKDRGGLYLKLGFLSGLAFVILIV